MQRWEYCTVLAEPEDISDELKKWKKKQPCQLDPSYDWSYEASSKQPYCMLTRSESDTVSLLVECEFIQTAEKNFAVDREYPVICKRMTERTIKRIIVLSNVASHSLVKQRGVYLTQRAIHAIPTTTTRRAVE